MKEKCYKYYQEIDINLLERIDYPENKYQFYKFSHNVEEKWNGCYAECASMSFNFHRDPRQSNNYYYCDELELFCIEKKYDKIIKYDLQSLNENYSNEPEYKRLLREEKERLNEMIKEFKIKEAFINSGLSAKEENVFFIMARNGIRYNKNI